MTESNQSIELVVRGKNRKAYRATVPLPFKLEELPTILWQAGYKIVHAIKKDQEEK